MTTRVHKLTLDHTIPYSPPPEPQATFSLDASSYSGTEGNQIQFTINRGIRTDQVIDIDWAVTNATVSPVSGTERFQLGESSKTITVTAGLVQTTEIGDVAIADPVIISGPNVTPLLGNPFAATFTINDSSFDWTHGLGMPVFGTAEDVMGPRWGVGAAGTRIIDKQYGTTNDCLQFYEQFRTWFSTLGDYVTYNIDPPANYTWDLFIDARTWIDLVPYAIHIGKWRNVIVLADDEDMLLQTTAWLLAYDPSSTRGNERWACANKDWNGPLRTNWTPGKNLSDVNDLTIPNPYYGNPGSYTPTFDSERAPLKGWNIHPRMAGATMLRSEHSGYLWVEGCSFEANGQQGDGMIMADNSAGTTANNANRRTYLVNCRIMNYDGQSTHKNYGDGIHGDSYHSQSGQENSVYHWNCWIISGQEGSVRTGTQGSNPMQYFYSKNYQYILLDPLTSFLNLNDYSPPGEKSSGAVLSNPYATIAQEGTRESGKKWQHLNVWVENKTSNIIKLSDGTVNLEHAEVHQGVSTTDFAPAIRIGRNYGNTSLSNDYFNSLG